MQITVHLTQAVASSFHQPGNDCSDAKSLRAQLVKAQVMIIPLHESTDDSELLTHFYLEVSNTRSIELNLDGKVTINVRSADVTVNVGDKKIELTDS